MKKYHVNVVALVEVEEDTLIEAASEEEAHQAALDQLAESYVIHEILETDIDEA